MNRTKPAFVSGAALAIFFAFTLVFATSANGQTEKVLHNFGGSSQQHFLQDGANPSAGLIFDNRGHLYGTTEYGGNSAFPPDCGFGCGIVFELTTGSDDS